MKIKFIEAPPAREYKVGEVVDLNGFVAEGYARKYILRGWAVEYVEPKPVDPVKAAHETQNWQGDLYNAAQLALRAVVNGVAVEALLNQRLEIGAQLLARVQPEVAKIGINVRAVEVKDLIFPADLKRAFGEVLKAKQEGQAALERARGEGAALRNLANAARVLEGNPALMNLRLMQSLSAARTAGNTLMLGVPGGFVPLKNGASPRAEKPTES